MPGPGELLPWLFRVFVVLLVLGIIAFAMDYFVLRRLPEPARMVGNIILGVFFLIVLLSLFGISL